MDGQEDMSDEEATKVLQQLVGTPSLPDEKQGVHTFLNNVAVAEDTTKTGYLKEEEVGTPKLPQRTLKELALFCKDVANMPYYAEYFLKKAEILTSTSLSKDAKLITLAVIQKREVSNISRDNLVKKKRGLFGRRKPETELEGGI